MRQAQRSGRSRNGNQSNQPTRDTVTRFFAELAAAGHVPTFERNSATLRFDVTNDGKSAGGPAEITERWYVAVTNGDVTVSHRNASADAIVRIQRSCLESVVTGRLNAQAAFLRGLFTCEGSMAAVMMFQRCLPAPPGSTGRIAPISSAQVMAERRAG
ncbi:MAG: SCP2 sterol-binding domain-containing protein [Streptosporangiaceae bacterium]